jgi:hypothetical protein
LEVLFGEGPDIGDDEPAAAHVGQVDLERCGVHGDQDVDHIAGGLDAGGAEIDLIGGDSEGGPGRRPAETPKVVPAGARISAGKSG